MDDLTGRTLGDFVIRHRLGEGGYGAVYRAEQSALGREAVVKVLHDHHRDSKTVIQRFLREARLASKLDHPYAAHIYAFGVETDGLMWIAMEYVRGMSLHELLRTRGPMPLEELVPLLDRICEVLQAAHDLGIVHRDIKPPNVMVVQRSGRAFPKLLDFGIAKITEDDLTPPTEVASKPASKPAAPTPIATPSPVARQAIEPVGDATLSFVGELGGAVGALLARAIPVHAEPQAPIKETGGFAATMEAGAARAGVALANIEALTEAGAAIGSPPYMAPEQWGDAADATARTDLYALGVLTFETLTGRRPFTGTTVTAYATAHATMPVPPLGDAHPSALDEVMQKVLAKEPSDRYGSALEFAQAFRSAAGFGTQPLPGLDEDLRLSVEASFPQPIAEAVAAFHAARNAHQGRDALREIATTATRYLAMVALAARAQVRLAEVAGSAPLAELVRDLRRRPLRDEEWLRFARELVGSFRARPQAHPMPELVALLDQTTANDPLDTLAQMRTTEPDPLVTIRELLPVATRLLRTLSFLADYPLVVVTADGDRAESWMGVRRPRRVALEVRGRTIASGQPALLDAAGRPTIVLHPVVQTSAPMPGAPAELFMLDGGGRRGARMTAPPNTLERQDEDVWAWLADKFSSPDHDSKISSDDTLASRPYRGLSAFTAEDAETFVGREREIDAAINRLRTSALVAVVGPSGAGKSSFVHAGILPALPKSWATISVRPGASPLAALELRLARAGIQVSGLAENPSALATAFARSKTTTVLVIDQFEELFTLGTPANERRAYVRALLAAAQAPADNVRVVLTLRDDFLARAAQLPELRDHLPTSLFVLGTPARDDLVRILTQPLARKGFDFEDAGLPARMVDEVADTPGALALLSFTAAKLWELRDRHFRQLTRKAYDALGGVGGALAHHAESTLTGLSANEQRLARTAFRHLVTAEGTRASLARGELAQLLRDPAANAVVEKLVSARLLVTTESEGGDDRVEIVHEALVAAWPRLAQWRREDAEGARLRDQIRAAARQWVERDKANGLLWRDDALAELQVWRTRHPKSLTDAEEAFARASIAEATRGRRVRSGVIVVVIGLMAVAVAVLVWARSNLQATANRDRARVRAELVERGRQNVLSGDFTRARDALAEARRLGATDSAALRFLDSIAARPIQGQIAKLQGHQAAVIDVELSRDGTRVVTASGDGTSRLWDAGTGAEIARLGTCNVLGASFSPGGRRIAIECADAVRLFTAAGGLERELVVARSRTTQAPISYARWIDGRRLATSTRGVLEIWEVATGRRLWASPDTSPQGRIAIAPDATIIASMTVGAPEVTLWNTENGAALHAIKLATSRVEPIYLEPTALAFDPSGAHLFTVARRTELVQIWDVASGELAGALEPRAGVIASLDITRTGRAVIATRDAIQIWALASATLERSLEIGANRVIDLELGPDDLVLGATMNDGAVAIWNLASGTQIAGLQGHDGAVQTLAFDASGERVVTGGSDTTAIVWNLRSTTATKVMAIASPANRLDVRGGRMLVATDHAIVWNLSDGKLLARRAIGPNADARFVDDRTVAIVDREGRLVLWDLTTSGVREVARHRGAGDWIEVDGTGSCASWAGPEVIVADRELRFRWEAPANVVALAFIADGGLAIADAEGTIHILDRSGKSLRSWPTKQGPKEWVSRLLALPDGRLITSSSYVARVWSSTGERLHELDHPTAQVWGMAIDRRARELATTGEDGTIRIWDLATYELRRKLPHTWAVRQLAFADDDILTTLDDVGVVHVWDLTTGDPLFRFLAHHGRSLLRVTESAIVTAGQETVSVFPTR